MNQQTSDLVNHCVDCCCARSWAALGVTEYDGKSIPEHITRLRERVAALEAENAKLKEWRVLDNNAAVECLTEERMKRERAEAERDHWWRGFADLHKFTEGVKVERDKAEAECIALREIVTDHEKLWREQYAEQAAVIAALDKGQK